MPSVACVGWTDFQAQAAADAQIEKAVLLAETPGGRMSDGLSDVGCPLAVAFTTAGVAIPAASVTNAARRDRSTGGGAPSRCLNLNVVRASGQSATQSMQRLQSSGLKSPAAENASIRQVLTQDAPAGHLGHDLKGTLCRCVNCAAMLTIAPSGQRYRHQNRRLKNASPQMTAIIATATPESRNARSLKGRM